MSNDFINSSPLLREIQSMKDFETIWRNTDRLQAVNDAIDRSVRDEYTRTLRMSKGIARDQILSRMAVLCQDFLGKYNSTSNIAHEIDREAVLDRLCEDLMKVLDVVRYNNK